LVLTLLYLAAVAPAWAAPPPNDTRDQATVIAALPFTETIDTSEATIGPDDDAAATTCGLPSPYPKSVWYRYTPATDHSLVIDTAGSGYSVGVGVGTGVTCVATFPGEGSFFAQADQTYFIAVVDIGAGAGGSLQLSVEINQAPVCEDVAISVQAGTSVAVPSPDCVDPEDDLLSIFILDEPTHGVFDLSTTRYTPSPGYVGQDSMSFYAIDSRGAESELGVVTITVTPAPQPPAPPPSPGPTTQSQPIPHAPLDVTAPSLELVAPSSLTLRTARRRGLRFTATTNEAGHIVARAFVDRKTARRLKIKRNPTGPVAVGALARDIGAGETVLKINLSRKARGRLKRAPKVKLRIIASITDSTGNVRTQTLRITLKR
jgi:hypothetical protein